MNNSIPEVIAAEVKEARKGFSELRNVDIQFKIKKSLRGSIMKAQPKFLDFFKNRKKRGYVILVSETFSIGNTTFTTTKLPADIKIGWFAHELGHIRDYQNLTSWGLLRFGFLYLFSRPFMRAAELRADTFAVEAGYGSYLIKTKNFILDHAELPESYKNKIRKYYTSLDQILKIGQNLNLISEMEE